MPDILDEKIYYKCRTFNTRDCFEHEHPIMIKYWNSTNSPKNRSRAFPDNKIPFLNSICRNCKFYDIL